jgi:uncharacterized protein YndB with AHSA1/START domain
MANHTATVDVDISAAPAQVWEALTDPNVIRKYFFGAEVDSTWEPGTPITWSGEYDGQSYQDKGEVLECVPGQRLRMTHFSPLSGQEDKPENYHHLTYEITDHGDHTHLSLKQDNNADEAARDASQKNWVFVLNGLKECVERG